MNEPLLIEDESSAAKGVKTVSKMTAEEAKAKADELRRNAAAKKAERLLEEREMERLREQERIRSGKELTEAKKMEDELSLKRNIEQRRAEKEEMDRAARTESRLTRIDAATETRFAGGDDAEELEEGRREARRKRWRRRSRARRRRECTSNRCQSGCSENTWWTLKSVHRGPRQRDDVFQDVIDVSRQHRARTE